MCNVAFRVHGNGRVVEGCPGARHLAGSEHDSAQAFMEQVLHSTYRPLFNNHQRPAASSSTALPFRRTSHDILLYGKVLDEL